MVKKCFVGAIVSLALFSFSAVVSAQNEISRTGIAQFLESFVRSKGNFMASGGPNCPNSFGLLRYKAKLQIGVSGKTAYASEHDLAVCPVKAFPVIVVETKSFEFKDLDPSRVKVVNLDNQVEGRKVGVWVDCRNDFECVDVHGLLFSVSGGRQNYKKKRSQLELVVETRADAERLQRGLRAAITAFGGKRSMF
jgi:hypothetical protein